MPVEEQIAVLYCGINNLLRDIPMSLVAEFEKTFLEVMRARCRESVLEKLAAGIIDDGVKLEIEKVAQEVVLSYKNDI